MPTGSPACHSEAIADHEQDKRRKEGGARASGQVVFGKPLQILKTTLAAKPEICFLMVHIYGVDDAVKYTPEGIMHCSCVSIRGLHPQRAVYKGRICFEGSCNCGSQMDRILHQDSLHE